jgi:hypothetical protein
VTAFASIPAVAGITAVAGRVADPDPDWIRTQSGQWIRIRIQEGKNEPQKYKLFLMLMF